MPARDRYHSSCKNALIKDGWIITHDPLRLQWGTKDMYVDLGAEEIVTAQKEGRKIAVEIKSFVGASELNDIENALGQYCVYRSVMTRTEPNRKLYLAVHNEVYVDIFKGDLGQLILEDYQISLLIFDMKREVILQWIA